AGLLADARHRIAPDPLAECGRRHGAEIAAEARAADGDSLGVDGVMLRQHGMHSEAGGPEIGRGEKDAAADRFGLTRPVDREHGEAALEETVAMDRDHALLAAVHAADRDHAGEALSARRLSRQVQIGRQALALEGDLDSLDRMPGVADELRVAAVHPLLIAMQKRRRLEDRPAGRGPEQRRRDVMLAGGDEPPLGFVAVGRGLALPRLRGELAVDVVEAPHAPRRRLEIRLRHLAAGPAFRGDAILIPSGPDRADGEVEQPALLLPPADALLYRDGRHF